MRQKLTLSVDPEILKKFRSTYHGSISAFLDGCMTFYLKLQEKQD